MRFGCGGKPVYGMPVGDARAICLDLVRYYVGGGKDEFLLLQRELLQIPEIGQTPRWPLARNMSIASAGLH